MSGTDNDPECQKGMFDQDEDALNLRCFHQKQRFGIDFLYPTQRYADALSKATLEDGHVNPLFCATPSADGKSCTGTQRNATQILIAGIVGVPWQLLANDPKDLKKGYKVASALPWDAIAGDVDNYVDPTDPFMVPSIDPRTGTSSIAGEATKPSSSAANASPVNGHEWGRPGSQRPAVRLRLRAARLRRTARTATHPATALRASTGTTLCARLPTAPTARRSTRPRPTRRRAS